jgi:23S rRNA-/tRNA-specific pseudouridylate synthase
VGSSITAARISCRVQTPDLLLETRDLLVVNKPAGWLVHAVGTQAPDLVTWASTSGLGRVRPAHRLDLDTSGVVLLARNALAAGSLGTALAEGQVEKRYLGLVFESPADTGMIDVPLVDARRGRPLPTRTEWRVVERLGRFTLLELQPLTGRKHQLRRHLHGIGHPLVGDVLYPMRPFRKVPGFPHRLWLHAAKLTLPDGRTFTAPLPPELAAHLAVLREPLAS